ncbi:AGZA family xanthine/uracil permease-like MFS transporter [Allocatelliglobosispora scoriae]|uniref:AGZA family xanthine/uracil permease-like MFS transporter n=2 Tax=Allocatelliglobosispora scoriae TaxID=643052 RepID=A0A841BXD4_9ACTN|nr:AGZA family xanthine/uracil permease-like MFS transporter [Allocatelliglobosispora scoriae]
MAYIVVLNPLILGGGKDKFGATLDPVAVAAATALVAGLMTILMGTLARFPLALAAGLGVNAMVAYEIAPKMTWADAMGLVVIEGLIIGVLVLTGLREKIFHSVPAQLKIAIGVGIGLFLTVIGFVDAGFVRSTMQSSGPPIGLGVGGRIITWPGLVFVLGLLFTIVLVVRKVKAAILIGIAVSTVLAIIVEAFAKVGSSLGGSKPAGWSLNVPSWPDKVFDLPDLSLLGKFSLLGSWQEAGFIVAVMFVFTLLLTDFFDTMGTMVAVGQQAGPEGGLIGPDGMPPRTREILLVDSVAAAAGGAASVSSNTSYIESASGVAEGARTGVANLVTGALFLLAMFVAPLVLVVPFEAASVALVVVGFLMMSSIKLIDWADYEIAIPAFLAIVIMPFTYSISNGIGAGVIAYTLIKLVRGKAREVPTLLWVVSALFVVYFARGAIEAVIN